MTTLIDFRNADAKRLPDDGAIEFDLSGCEALIGYIRPHMDALRTKREQPDVEDAA